MRQPIDLALYLVVGIGVSYSGPLHSPDAPDLAGSTSAEASGVARLLWQVARLALLVSLTGMGVAVFLRGW